MFDRIQKRYGWTDDVILNIPIARLMQINRVIAKNEQEEFKERYLFVLRQCFPWEAKENETFNDYLKRCGYFSNEQNGEHIDVESEKERALKIAERIIASDKKVVR